MQAVSAYTPSVHSEKLRKKRQKSAKNAKNRKKYKKFDFGRYFYCNFFSCLILLGKVPKSRENGGPAQDFAEILDIFLASKMRKKSTGIVNFSVKRVDI